MYLYIVQMACYLSIVQMEGAPPPTRTRGAKPMSALTQLGRFFDASVAVVFVLISLSLAGATAAVGA
jgi:hypothetical protein